MVIRLAQERDRDAWNRVAQASPHSSYTHTWEWKETLERGMNVRPLCLLAEEQGEVVGIYPGFLAPRFKRAGNLVWLKMLLLGDAQVLWSPLYHSWDHGGPCVQPGMPDDLQAQMISAMEEMARRRKAMDTWISPPPNSPSHALLRGKGYHVIPRSTALIDLTKSEEELWDGLKKETRSQIRQGQKLGLEASEETNSNGVEALYVCLQNMAGRKDVELPPRAFFEAAFELLAPSKLVRIYSVKHKGQTVGSAMFVYYNGRTVGRFWGALKEALPLRPYHVLMWKILTNARRLGIHTCDLGGMPADEQNGIHRFKKGWGVKVVPVDWYVKTIRFQRTMTLGQQLLRLRGRKLSSLNTWAKTEH